MANLRRFKALVTEMGYDDIGMSGLTFETPCLIKSNIYMEEDPIRFGDSPITQEPFIVDHTGCIRYIKTLIEKGLIEEIK